MRHKKREHKNTAAIMLESARDLFRIGLPHVIGVRPASVTQKKITATMHVKPMHLNRNKHVSGGVLMAIADVMGAAGAIANRPLNYTGGTIESKTNFFGAALGPVLTAICVPLHRGRTISVWQTTIKNPDGRVIAIVTQTQIDLLRTIEST